MMKRVKRDGGGHPESIVLFFNGFDDRSFLLRHNQPHELASGIVLPADLAEVLISCTNKGREHMTTFIEKRINTNTISFWDPISKVKVKTFETVNSEESTIQGS